MSLTDSASRLHGNRPSKEEYFPLLLLSKKKLNIFETKQISICIHNARSLTLTEIPSEQLKMLSLSSSDAEASYMLGQHQELKKP